MNLKKVIRKVAAVGAGMTMVGATLMGALAANLNEYPAPFVTDGAFDAVLVVGDNAAPVDIIGVTDVAMALQYGMTTEEAVETTSSTTTVSDGKVEDELTLGYNTFLATQTYDDGDLTVLKDDEVRYNSADVQYKEEIGFAEDTFVAETGEADEDFGTNVYLTVDEGEIYYKWEPDSPLTVNFTADEELDISFLGLDLQITGIPADGEVTLSSANEVWMNRGESMTVTVSGEEYTIEFAGAYGDSDAKLVLNGETDYVTQSYLFDEDYDDFELYVIEVIDDTSDANEDAVKFKYGSTTSENADDGTAAEMLGYGDETSKAEWVWYIDSNATTQVITHVGVKYNQPLDEIESKITASWEKPVLGLGDSIVFPNDYAQIEFAALNFADDLADFTVTSKAASNWYNDDDVQVFYAASDYVIEFYSEDGDYLYYNNEPYTTVIFNKDLSNVGLVDSSDVRTNTTFNSTHLVIKVDETEQQVTVSNVTASLDTVSIAGMGNNSGVAGTYSGALVWNLDWVEDATAGEDMLQFVGVNISTRDYDFSTEYGAIIYDAEKGLEDDYGYIKFSLPSEKVTFDLAVSAESATTASSSVTTQVVTQIEVGAAKLASEVADITAVNAIVIGGPCANSAAATLMGNPSPCYAGFNEGEATVKLYENGGNVAMLIAGATGDDTRTAAKVVANGGISAIDGTEAVVTTLTETVTVPTVVEDETPEDDTEE